LAAGSGEKKPAAGSNVAGEHQPSSAGSSRSARRAKHDELLPDQSCKHDKRFKQIVPMGGFFFGELRPMFCFSDPEHSIGGILICEPFA
jgi:hypothetical protein